MSIAWAMSKPGLCIGNAYMIKFLFIKATESAKDLRKCCVILARKGWSLALTLLRNKPWKKLKGRTLVM